MADFYTYKKFLNLLYLEIVFWYKKHDPMTVAPDKLIPLMIKSIQDQQDIIDKLTERIEKLENK